MVFTRPSVVEMLSIDPPTAGAGEIVVDVTAAGICGSELHGISQPGFRQPPLVMGHEFVGTTPDGRRVTVNPILSCGGCDMCAAGSRQLCRERSIIGIHRPGAFAEQVAVPVQLARELPDSISWEAAALIEPLANAVHAWRIAGRPAGRRVGIIGAGTIGLVALLVVQRDTQDVVVTDVSDDRLEVARRLGAPVTGPELDGDFDVIIDAAGVGATRQASVAHLKPSGTTVWMGLGSADSAFDALGLIRNEKRVLGSFAYTDGDFNAAVELSTDVDLSWATSYPLEEGPAIFMQLMNGRSDVVKALLRP
jgi:threonine dehydrogenase-like Zn-dependent dehydrogenase